MYERPGCDTGLGLQFILHPFVCLRMKLWKQSVQFIGCREEVSKKHFLASTYTDQWWCAVAISFHSMSVFCWFTINLKFQTDSNLFVCIWNVSDLSFRINTFFLPIGQLWDKSCTTPRVQFMKNVVKIIPMELRNFFLINVCLSKIAKLARSLTVKLCLK